MDVCDSGSVFWPSLSDVCGRHCSPTMVLWLLPWYPRKGKYSLLALSRCPTGEHLRTPSRRSSENTLPRTRVNRA